MSIALYARPLLLAVALASVVVGGCSTTGEDLSRTAKYQSVIGSEYRTRTPLYALGLKSGADPNQIARIWVSPVVGTDSNVAFQRPIPAGHVFRVIAVRKRFVPLENGLQFVVATEGLDLPQGVEIVIPLYGYMESADGFPNSDRFERIAAPARLD